MKFSTTIFRITPFSAVCSMAGAATALFLPGLVLSSVAGDAEEGARRFFDAALSLLLGAADPMREPGAWIDSLH